MKKISIEPDKIYNTAVKANILSAFSQYVQIGGFPGYIRNERKEYLKTLYESVLFRDIMVRNNLTNEHEMLELVHYIASNISKLSSYISLAKTIGIRNSTTIKNYLSFLEDSYLIFQVKKFDFSVKKQVLNPKKMYMIDQAFVRTIGFHFSEQRGRLLENIVFIELLRRGKEVYYYSDKRECDFVVRHEGMITELIQVTTSLDDPTVWNREINGLVEAMDKFGLRNGLIITENEENVLEIKGYKVNVMPMWKWLLKL